MSNLHNPTRTATRYLDRTLVEMYLAAAGNTLVTVYVDNKAGQERAYNGHLNPHKSFVGGERGERQSQVLKDNGLRFMKRGDRKVSFYLDKVRGIAANGERIGDCSVAE